MSATSAGLQQSFEFVRLGLNGPNPARNSRPCVADTPPAYACQASRPAKPNGPAREPDLMRGLADQPAERPARFLPQSACYLCCASGDVRCRWQGCHQRRRVAVGEILVALGVRTIPFGIAAVVLGFGLRSLGTQAGPADVGLRGPSLSVFGTIHPDIFRLPEPIGSALPGDRIRLASSDRRSGLMPRPLDRTC